MRTPGGALLVRGDALHLVYRSRRLDGPLGAFHEAIDLLERDTCFGEVTWTGGPEPERTLGCQPGQPCRRHRPRQRAQEERA